MSPAHAAGLLYSFDRVPYHAAWELQRVLHEERANGQRPDTFLVLEHDPVYTLGRNAKDTHWSGDESALRSADVALYRVNRGGSVTYHGPGQVVGYPILSLKDYCAGPKSYMRLLEEVLIRTLADWDIVGGRIEQFPGVWVGQPSPAKIAAMGVHVSRGVTMHGFALNVSVDLAPFSRIVPCGLADCRTTSMAEILGSPIPVAPVRSALIGHFEDVFQIELTHVSSLGCDPAWTGATDRPLPHGLHPPIETRIA